MKQGSAPPKQILQTGSMLASVRLYRSGGPFSVEHYVSPALSEGRGPIMCYGTGASPAVVDHGPGAQPPASVGDFRLLPIGVGHGVAPHLPVPQLLFTATVNGYELCLWTGISPHDERPGHSP